VRLRGSPVVIFRFPLFLVFLRVEIQRFGSEPRRHCSRDEAASHFLMELRVRESSARYTTRERYKKLRRWKRWNYPTHSSRLPSDCAINPPSWPAGSPYHGFYLYLVVSSVSISSNAIGIHSCGLPMPTAAAAAAAAMSPRPSYLTTIRSGSLSRIAPQPACTALSRSISTTRRRQNSGSFNRSDFGSQPFTGIYDPSAPTAGPLGGTSNVGAPTITPKMLKDHLDQFVVGQDRAKKVLSTAVYNHYQRIRELQRLEDEEDRKAAQRARREMGMGRQESSPPKPESVERVKKGANADSSSRHPVEGMRPMVFLCRLKKSRRRRWENSYQRKL
jgi:hypothetical protein